jgi:hypothetical protein
MKRLLTSFALAAILVGIVSPLAVALQASSTPSCCLPGGKHHCSQSPDGPGFNSNSEPCPYASELFLTEIAGLQARTYSLAAPQPTSEYIAGATDSGYRVFVREISARGPPPSFH